MKLIIKRAQSSAIQAVAVMMVFTIAYMFLLEPAVGRGQATDVFTVTQTVSGAIAFAATANDVTMNGTLNGLTGGTTYGTTTSRVTTNNASGFNLTIHFSSTTAMKRNGSNDVIANYMYSTGTASYPAGFDTTPSNAQFGFSVNASNTSNISSVFTHSGSLCGTSNNGSFTVNNCWRGASTTATNTAATQLINVTAPTPSSGVTSTVQFRVTIPNGPSPAVPDGTYVATATLTATDNP